ncbi:hypothetical protein [Ruegeria arenilitoris]|uniref:hypothetical protein n=1 Tax=Ruegeria arenilitoris TaxID=1173585 RepID=UPI0014801DB0|nr:hypothetical protein [Ruegeria arenilitoris]
MTKLGKNGFRVVTPDTDLVIEGFPRSGNSYVEAAFRASQKTDIRLAHHTHAAANVLRAVQLDKPCYVLIRSPEDACISLVIQEPSVQDLELALSEYERFHRGISCVADQICLVPFEIATQNFNAGIGHLNARYGTRFALLSEDIDRNRIMAQVDAISRQRNTVKDGVEPYSPYATDDVRQARKAEQERLKNRLQEPALAKRLDRCTAIYRQLLPKSGLYELMQDTAA